MVERGLLTRDLRIQVESGNMVVATLMAACDIEELAFEKLFFEQKLSPKLLGQWTLGKYLRWCFELNLFDAKWVSALKKFNRLRNIIAHNRGIGRRIIYVKEKEQKIKDLLLQMCDFIDETKINYSHSQELEKKYGDWHVDLDKKLDFL